MIVPLTDKEIMDRYHKKVQEEKALWQGDPPKKEEKWIDMSDPHLWQVIALVIFLLLFGAAYGISLIPSVENKELICLSILGSFLLIMILFIVHYYRKGKRIV